MESSFQILDNQNSQGDDQMADPDGNRFTHAYISKQSSSSRTCFYQDLGDTHLIWISKQYWIPWQLFLSTLVVAAFMQERIGKRCQDTSMEWTDRLSALAAVESAIWIYRYALHVPAKANVCLWWVLLHVSVPAAARRREICGRTMQP